VTHPEGSPEPRSAAEVRVTIASLLASLGWVVLGLLSLLTGLIALITTTAMGHSANPGTDALWVWLTAFGISFGVPFALSAWKHSGSPDRIRATMAWLPTVWNTAGLLVATMLIPDITGTALRKLDWVVQGQLGDSHPTTRALSALGHELAEEIDPAGGDFPAPRLKPSTLSLENAISVPMAHDGAAIFLDVQLGGPSGKRDLTYLFDTGASYTTITSDVAHELGLVVPKDAPTLEFNTATGLRESRMIYLDSLAFAGITVNGILVSVCDSCATEHTSGLLGLNVMREFFVQMDYQDRQMQLIPRMHEGRPNRAYDIEPLVHMEIEDHPEIWLGRVRWVILLTNNSSRALEEVLPRVEFKNGPILFGQRIGRIAAGAQARSLLVGRATANTTERGGSVEFTLSLAEAHW